jgi:hypothetical protein
MALLAEVQTAAAKNSNDEIRMTKQMHDLVY